MQRIPARFDLLVLGAGIAGLSVAYAANRSGLKTAVLDRHFPGNGASGAPQALLNPATGRKAKKCWNAEECLAYTRTLLETVHRHTGIHFYSMNGILRPALDAKLAEDMVETYSGSSWPENWIEWLDEDRLTSRFPGLNCSQGGLWIPAGGTVAFGLFMKSFHRYLKLEGVHFYLGSEGNLPENGSFPTTNGTAGIQAENIVYATGRSMTGDSIWKMLPLNQVKGQTLSVEIKQKLPFNCSVSSLGYIAQTEQATDRIVLGSTYEHHFSHDRPDKKGANYLLDRMERTLPGLRNRVVKSRGWSGIRVTTPDKKPFIGKHPDADNVYAIGALGSKGLLLAPYLGKLLVRLITHGDEVPPLFTIERLVS
ncbi:MAG: FAD-dependent oxidoreductase [Balneolaceae bacterium]